MSRGRHRRSRPPALGTAPRRQTPEADLQRAAVEWLTYAYPAGGPVLWFHPPNGGTLAGEVGRMKGLGARAGIPDLVFMFSRTWLYTAASSDPAGFEQRELGPLPSVAYAELKAPRGKLSPEQVLMRDWIRELGAPWAEIRSLDELAAFLESIPGFPPPRAVFS